MEDPDSDTDYSWAGSFTGVISIRESLVPAPDVKQASITETSLDGLLEIPLRLKEDLKEGCGGQLWPAGMVLARYMLKYHRTTLANKTILELGAGGGIVGLAVAQGCKDIDKIYITDQEPMLSLMHENIKLNSLSDRVSASIFDWGNRMPTGLASSFVQGDSGPNIVLAADCVYFEPAFPLLKNTLVDIIGERTVCYFCFKKRRRADWRFVKMVSKILDVREVVDDEDRQWYSKDSIFLYKITKKA